MEKQKCPACGEKTIDFFSKYFLRRQTSFVCDNCDAKVGIKVIAHLIFMTIIMVSILSFIIDLTVLGILIFFCGNLVYFLVMMVKPPLVEKK